MFGARHVARSVRRMMAACVVGALHCRMLQAKPFRWCARPEVDEVKTTTTWHGALGLWFTQ